MSKKDNINVTTPATGRSIGQNLKLTDKMVGTATKAGTTILGGKK